MGCFSGHCKGKRSRRGVEKQPRSASMTMLMTCGDGDEDDHESPSSIKGGGNRKLSSLHPGNGGRRKDIASSSSSSSSFWIRRAYSVAESHAQASKNSFAMPLPLPARPCRYRLPPPSSDNSRTLPIICSCHSSKAPCNLHKIPTSNPQPLPPPPQQLDLQRLPGLRTFSYQELASACNNFSPDRCVGESSTSLTYTGVVGSEGKPEFQKQLEVTVVRLISYKQRWQQSCKEWHAKLATLAKLHSSNHLCKMIGYHGEEGEGKERLLVYEKLARGSLDGLLYGKKESPPLDWHSRLKIAIGAAEDLAYLHDTQPEPIVYTDFGACQIEVDMDFNAKVWGYTGCGEGRSDNSEEGEDKCSSRNGNVWSFGVVLLELLTGRKHMDPQAPKEERNLVHWTRPFLAAEGRLFLVMDWKLQGRFPEHSASIVASIAHKCFHHDISKRATMTEVLNALHHAFARGSVSVNPFTNPSIGNRQLRRSSFDSAGHSKISRRDRLVWSQQLPANHGKVVTNSDLIDTPPLKPLIIPRTSNSSSCTLTAMEEHKLMPISSRPRPSSSSRMQLLSRLESF